MNWMRVGAAALVTGACALLVACGSGSVVSDFDFQEGTQLRSDASSKKGRVITVGDDFADIGQNDYVFSVNGDTVSVNGHTAVNWVQQLAAHYDVGLRPAKQGGWAYAQGSARVSAPDDENGAPSVKEQVDQLLADTKLRKNDLVFINGGMNDIVAAVEANGVDAQTTLDAVEDAAAALVTQVKRLLDKGAGHVAVTGVWDIGTSPWAGDLGERSDPKKDGPVTKLTLLFNDYVKLNLPNDGKKIAYLDAALFYRFIYDDDDRDSYGVKVANNNKLACGKTPLKDCKKSTLNLEYNEYLFADALHFTPRVWRYFGDDDFGSNAYDTIGGLWGWP